MSVTFQDVEPYLSLAGQVLPSLIQGIERAVAQHQGGDPVAALATLNATLDECGPKIVAVLQGITADRKEGDAYEDAKFPPPATLADTARAVVSQLRERFAGPWPTPVLVKDGQ